MKTHKKIGLIATGDELIHGDILNTNGQRFCQRFVELGMLPGQQITVGDNCVEIENAIRYLRQTHAAIITIGGLGPTIDDVTRRALANALARPLEYHAQAWDWIVEKIHSLGYTDVPENNRQQAFFPSGAEIFRNEHGTAAACYIKEGAGEMRQDFFMLPGPPNECLPLFEREVLTRLSTKDYITPCRRLSWLLIGVSEGAMAERLEPLLLNYPDVQLGFRVSYPYLEIKLASENHAALDLASADIVKIIGPQVVSQTRETASELLKKYLKQHHIYLLIEDHATRGAFSKAFEKHDTDTIPLKLVIRGLTQYWDNPKTLSNDFIDIHLEGELAGENILKNWRIDAPLRGERSIPAAVERIAYRLLTAFPRG
jgi:nicotinamide-nucleotide amidase